MPSAVVTLIGAIDVITQPSPKDRVRWCVKLNVSNTSHSLWVYAYTMAFHSTQSTGAEEKNDGQKE